MRDIMRVMGACEAMRVSDLSCSTRGAGLRQHKMAIGKVLVCSGILLRLAFGCLVDVLPENHVILHALDALADAQAVLNQQAG